jgi:hypothetical protein
VEQLLDFIEKDTSIRSHDMETVFAWLADALAFFISLGNRVATDVGTFTPAIKAGALPPEFRASDIPEAVLRMNFIVNKPLIHALRKEADFEVKNPSAAHGSGNLGILTGGRGPI